MMMKYDAKDNDDDDNDNDRDDHEQQSTKLSPDTNSGNSADE
jgi:hypothetical protein